MKTIKIGSKVRYRGGFGQHEPEVVTIEGIEKVKDGEKYGRAVCSIPFADREHGVFDLDNGHWCYGYQIEEVVG